MASIPRRLAVYFGLLEDDHQSKDEENAPHPELPNDPKDAIKTDSDLASKRRVMVIYGHDTEAYRALLGWLRAIGLEPLEWSHLVKLSGDASPYNGQVLDHAFRKAQAVLCLFTPDEHVVTRGASPTGRSEWRLQARPNVLIEAGMALAIHPQRTFLVMLGEQKLPSDLDGRDYIRLDRTSGPLYELASRLKNAGCDVNLTGTQWLDPEYFPNRDNLPPAPMG